MTVIGAAALLLGSGGALRPRSARAETGGGVYYVVFQGPINDTTASRLISIVGTLLPKGLKELHRIVGTRGGSIADALLVYGFLRGLSAKVLTYNLSTVASAGNIIYLAGERRISTSNAFFQFHNVAENFPKPPASMTLDEFTETKTSLAMSLDRMEQVYRDRTSLTSAQIEEFRQRAVFFDAAAAQTAGITHEIAALTIPPAAAITVVNTASTQTSP